MPLYNPPVSSGSTVTVDADGTLVVDGTTVEVGTDSEIAAALAAKASKGYAAGLALALGG